MAKKPSTCSGCSFKGSLFSCYKLSLEYRLAHDWTRQTHKISVKDLSKWTIYKDSFGRPLNKNARFARYPKIISAQGFYARSLDNSLQENGRVDEKFPNTSKYDARHEILKYLKVKTGKLQEKHQFCKCEWTLGIRAAIHAKSAYTNSRKWNASHDHFWMFQN